MPILGHRIGQLSQLLREVSSRDRSHQMVIGIHPHTHVIVYIGVLTPRNLQLEILSSATIQNLS